MSSFLTDYATLGFAMMVLSLLASLLKIKQTIRLLKRRQYLAFGSTVMTGVLSVVLWPVTLFWVCYVIIFTRE